MATSTVVPQDPDATTRADFKGNDDHPAYSDAQISEALLADEINAIAASPYWSESAIIITYDETDGTEADGSWPRATPLAARTVHRPANCHMLYMNTKER